VHHKGTAVNRAEAETLDGIPVFLRPVPFVPHESISGVPLVVVPHEAIPRHFRHDGSGRDGETARVTSDDRRDRDVRRGIPIPVDEQMVGPEPESIDRHTHGTECGVKNVDVVDDFRFNNAHTDGQRVAENLRVGLFPLVFPQYLRVADAFKDQIVGEQRRSGHDRPGKRTPPGLVDPCNVHYPPTPEHSLCGKQARQQCFVCMGRVFRTHWRC
jgi:hypothetical protein